MADEKEEMLINFNSPEKSCNTPFQKTYLKNPLIPGPDNNCNVESNNPFDAVANSAENWDPFELVLRESLMKFDSNENNKNEEKKSVKVYKKVKTPSPKKTKYDNFSPRKVLRSQSVTENILCFNSPTIKSGNVDSESMGNSTDDSWSIRERIKRVVKHRVSECIENAINSSVSQPDLRKADPPSPFKCMNNIISQIVGRNSEAKIGKSTEIPYSEIRNERVREAEPQNKCFKSPEVKLHNNSFKYQSEKASSELISKNEDIFDIVKRAQDVSIAFQSMSLSETQKYEPCNSQLIGNFEDENLMDIKPPWEENDDSPISSESEDSSIGLPKVKLFYMKKKEKERRGSEISAEEIAHYKKRIRASFDGNMYCDEDAPEKTIHRSPLEKTDSAAEPEKSPDEKNPPAVVKEKEPLEVLAVKPILPEVSDLRPKKKGSILKKGPMKALVPLQKMTKSLAEKVSSPLKRSSQLNGSYQKSKGDNSFTSSIIYPVAASTPNGKTLTKSSSPGTPTATKISFRNRISRKDNDKTGSVKRSSSLSTDSRTSNIKLPFSSVNTSAKSGRTINRPHTAPSNTKSIMFDRSSPKSKNNNLRKTLKSVATNDKENKMQVC